jgi:hypothetical protein
MISVKVGRYLISFDESVDHKIYNDGYVYGVKFEELGFVYDALCHEHLGERLLITKVPDQGYSRDVPLSEYSGHLLPKGLSLSYSWLLDEQSTLDGQVSADGCDGETSSGGDP